MSSIDNYNQYVADDVFSYTQHLEKSTKDLTWSVNDPLSGQTLRTFKNTYKVGSYGANPLNSTERTSTTYNTLGSSRIGFLQNNSYHYEIKDHRGTVRAVLINGADLQSSLVQYADYLPLGGKMNGRQFTNTGAQLSLGYQGEWATDETAKIGLIDFDLRQYDVTIGRWNNIDPYRQYASGFVGMGNDWPNIIDPSGGYGGGANGGTPKYDDSPSNRVTPSNNSSSSNMTYLMMRYTKAMTDLEIQMDHLKSSVSRMEASWDRAITNGLKSLGAGYNDPNFVSIGISGSWSIFSFSAGIGSVQDDTWGLYFSHGLITEYGFWDFLKNINSVNLNPTIGMGWLNSPMKLTFNSAFNGLSSTGKMPSLMTPYGGFELGNGYEGNSQSKITLKSFHLNLPMPGSKLGVGYGVSRSYGYGF